jgi:hypothetical protein
MKQLSGLAAALLIIVFSACDETESGYGTYTIGVSNSKGNNYNLAVYLDGASKGSFIVKAYQQGNYLGRCSDLVHTATLDNVYIISYVSAGKHSMELKDVSKNNAVVATGSFTMKADGCISQQIDF